MSQTVSETVIPAEAPSTKDAGLRRRLSKDRLVTRYFKKDSFVSFEIMLPTRKKVLMGAIVRNINFLENGIIKAGLEIANIDAISEVHYEEFLDGV